jgi:hypothetical protein
MGFRILFIGAVLALASSMVLAQATTSQPTAIVVSPPAVVPMVSSPIVTAPLVTTPSVRFENGPNGTTIPVVSNSAVVTQSALPGSSAAPEEVSSSTAAGGIRDLNLGSVASVSDLYGGDNRSIAEVARQYRARRNGVQNARVYTNADIERIRAQAGESSSSANTMPAGSMPASDQAAEQNNQSTTPQVPAPASNQKPSPFAPKK